MSIISKFSAADNSKKLNEPNKYSPDYKWNIFLLMLKYFKAAKI